MHFNDKLKRSVMDLNPRSQIVLTDLVDIYTETGQPVGSKALCERTNLTLSPATIRNVMAELEEKGYLASPHTSAGRIPTEDGFRYYVNGLVEVDTLSEDIKNQIQGKISNKPFAEVIDGVSKLLGEITGCAGLVVAPRKDMAELEQIEFIRLNDDKVLAVVVTADGSIENRVINVPDRISIDELNNSAKYMKDIVQGKTLADARVSMMQSLMEHKNQVDNLMTNMMDAAEQWAEPTVTDGALVVAGTQNLFQYPELVRDQLKDLFKAFEEKRMIMALMNEVQKGEGVQVFIGHDCHVSGANECSMVTSSYGTDDKKTIGTLGVIGPMRMDYRQTIQLVNYTSQLLSKALQNK